MSIISAVEGKNAAAKELLIADHNPQTRSSSCKESPAVSVSLSFPPFIKLVTMDVIWSENAGDMLSEPEVKWDWTKRRDFHMIISWSCKKNVILIDWWHWQWFHLVLSKPYVREPSAIKSMYPQVNQFLPVFSNLILCKWSYKFFIRARKAGWPGSYLIFW